MHDWQAANLLNPAILALVFDSIYWSLSDGYHYSAFRSDASLKINSYS